MIPFLVSATSVRGPVRAAVGYGAGFLRHAGSAVDSSASARSPGAARARA